MSRASHNDIDRETLRAYMAAVKKEFPAAKAVILETSDQDLYGFWTLEVLGPDDESITDGFDDFKNSDEEQSLGSLNWDGVVGEDSSGYAVLSIADWT